jgi:hypothetical protein
VQYAFDLWRKDARGYLRKGHEIVFTLSTGNFPERKMLVSSEPMDSPNTQSILGWFLRVRFIAIPKSTDESKFFTMTFRNIDTKKTTTQYFPMMEGEKSVY